MLVIDSKKALVLNTPKHEAICAAIPHARTFDHNGQTLTTLPHGVEEARVLRNLGFRKTPAPILHYYPWPSRGLTPMQHQQDTAAFLTLHKRALCLNAPGTGKSLAALWAADHMLQEGVIRRVVIVAPLSTLKPVWGKELFHHFPHRSFKILTGSKQKRLDLLQTDPEFVVINHDGFTIMAEHLTERDLVIYDEATAIKSPSSRRFRVLYKFLDLFQPGLWLMTGTPVAQHPTDAWALAKLVGPPGGIPHYTRFKDLVMQRVSQFKWIPRPEAKKICQSVLQPSIYFSLDECIELPQTNYLYHQCDLTKVQAKVFKEMREKAILMAHNIEAPNAAVVLNKMIQICCGAVYDNDREIVEFDPTERINLLLDVINEIDDKVIVYVPFRSVQSLVEDKLKAAGFDVASVHGDVSAKDRNQIFDDFQNTSRIQILLAHPKVAAHGLTLTAAKDIIWYAPIYSLEQYEQANARIRRLVTTGKTRVHHLYATGFEHGLYQRLTEKRLFLSDFLDLVRGVNDDQ